MAHALALGGMIGNATGLNPDGLSLDLQFAADKRLTARKGPTPVFSRGSSGTFVNADGLIVGKTTATTPSITPSIQAIGSQVNVTVPSGSVVGWVVGQPISLIVDTDGQDDPDANELWLIGNIVSIVGNTLTFTVTSRTGQAGSASSWTLGYRGPRFDHDPVTGDCKGLLIEQGRENLFQYSEIFNEAASSNYWDSATANAVTSNQATSPDGADTADLLTTSTTAYDCFVRRTINWLGSTQYSYSIFLNRGPSNHRYVGLYIGAGITGALQYPYFDFDNPTTVQIPSGAMIGTINSTRVDAYQNDWYRVSVTFTTAATPVTTYGGVYISTSNGTLSSTPTSGLDCYIWGIQAETGAFPTSYIPTTTASVARAADVCTITGGNFTSFYNQSEGTMFAESLKTTGPASNSHICGTSNGSYAEFIDFRYFSDSFIQNTTNHLNFTQFTTSRAYTLNAITRQAIAYALNDAAYCAQGGVVTVDVPPYTPPVVDRFQIGTAGTGVFMLNGCVRAIRYYRKRLPNAKLQSLTV
jgi:hypothetical protein